MSKLFALICVLIALSVVSSQSCSSTSALRALYGIGDTVATATADSGIKYCKSIKNSPVCCTATDMNKFQDKSSEIVTNLTTRVAARDIFLKSLQDEIPQIQISLRGFIQSIDAFEILMAASQGANGVNTTSEAYTNFTEILEAYEFLAVMVVDALSTTKANYTNYQKARTGCVVDMMKLQNAAYCLSCDPSATSKGYNTTSGDIALSTRVCNRLKTSCQSYIQIASSQNDVVIAAFLAEGLDLISQAIVSVMGGNMTAITDLDESYDEESDDEIDDATYAILAPAYLPSGCEEGGSCDWICDGLFTGGLVDMDALANGGSAYMEDDSSSGGRRRLLQSMANADLKAQNNRMLSSGDFDPDSDEAGVTVTFEDDPSTSSTTNSKFGSLSLGNLFVSVFVVISSVLLL